MRQMVTVKGRPTDSSTPRGTVEGLLARRFGGARCIFRPLLRMKTGEKPLGGYGEKVIISEILSLSKQSCCLRDIPTWYFACLSNWEALQRHSRIDGGTFNRSG